jgi:uncharacterized protein YjbJ (UPF0337 family)
MRLYILLVLAQKIPPVPVSGPLASCFPVWALSHFWVLIAKYFVCPTFKEAVMNWDQIEGKWKQYTGQMKEKWGKLTDDDWTQIAGKRDQLVGKIQERYGIAKDQAESQIDDFSRSLDKADAMNVKGKTTGSGR